MAKIDPSLGSSSLLELSLGTFAAEEPLPLDETESSQRTAHPENQGAYNMTSPHQYIHWMLSTYGKEEKCHRSSNEKKSTWGL
ncbi:uncharacterized protein N7458_002111 [Penicillium daleae]|uniref:Uncharacterized protein n=1 Tax=Penicillium daleae TaxID=63821 RepID=A0AAD6CCC6_9EURO|nr:uncharacterized protein N7458_002111 [Penicillium daleae]KAJ5460559.1 hypothetical protein N7458_002111 [Penicillium daleae]